MKKKIVVLALALSVVMAGCGSSSSSTTSSAESKAASSESSVTSESTTDTTTVSSSSTTNTTTASSSSATATAGKIDAADTGSATVYISTASGTSENGEVPVEIISQDTTADQIGVTAENFDGVKMTYIYIDGIVNNITQYGEMTDDVIELEGDALKEGTHNVQFIQYDNDSEDGNVVECHSAQYEVKIS